MTEGLSRLRLYKIYHGMLQRCTNPNNSNHQYYGGKGIAVCDEWSNKESGLKSFMEWSLSHGYNESLTIDRIDSSAGYAPDNCQWITLSENSRRAHASEDASTKKEKKRPERSPAREKVTRQIMVAIAHAGITASELARRTGQSPQNLSQKINRGNFTPKELEQMAVAMGGTLRAEFVFEDGTTI